uniref:Uncharacterized protein n=1 Tax=viral metagenome TaxID=1070528 RepID=A0A6C0ADR4_9ZZZZ
MDFIPKKINIKIFNSINPDLLDKSYEDDKWKTIWFQNDYKLFLINKKNNDCTTPFQINR